MTYPLLDPQAKRPITDDWTGWLRGGDSLASATVTGVNVLVAAAAGDVGAAGPVAITPAANAVTFWISGATADELAKVTVHGVTTQGEADDHTLYWQITHT